VLKKKKKHTQKGQVWKLQGVGGGNTYITLLVVLELCDVLMSFLREIFSFSYYCYRGDL